MKKVGLIGLGRMGYNLALNMLDHNTIVHAYDKSISEEVKQNNQIKLHDTLKDLVESLARPRILWLMVPAGEINRMGIQRLSY